MFKVSNDPHLAEKLEAITGLYLNPPEHAIVLCADEKSQIQALDRTQPGLPLKKGRCGTRTHDYKRNGTTTLFAAMSTLDGTVISMCDDRHRHQEWLKFLRVIDSVTPADKELHLIADNYATHKRPKVHKWLARHPRFHVYFTPTSSSRLNMVERFFRDLTERALRRGIFRDVEELIMAIGDFIDKHNDNPKPFVWTVGPTNPAFPGERDRIDLVRNWFRELPTLFTFIAWSAAVLAHAATLQADPSNYVALLRNLRPGDTLSLAPGRYRLLELSSLDGTSDEWITIAGPSVEPPAVIEGEPGHNTVEITDCSYLSIENLVIDSHGIPGAFGISARGKENNRTHHIRIEGNTLIGQNGGQQTDGISTKTPTWGWVIRYNKIIGAGTGLYLGDSDGTQPFVAGIIENNLVKDTIGYNMEIKDQQSIPAISGMPLSPTSTIIRNNVFIKDDQPSPDGDRPNLFVGTRPGSGLGALNGYEIYGNYFVHNHREALFQGSGMLSLHDNIFLDGPPDYPAVVLMKQDQALKYAVVYNNTIYTLGAGIRFNRAGTNGTAVGNLIFASNPISGLIEGVTSGNVTLPTEFASQYLRSPTFNPETADFYPLPLKCQGPPIDLTAFQTDADYTLDFNGTPKTQAAGAVVFRGAYAGEGQNPGLFTGIKPPYPPRPKIPRLIWIQPANARAGTRMRFTLTGANFANGATVNVSGGDIAVTDVTINRETEITAILIIGPGATLGNREISVTTATGTSKSFRLPLGSRNKQR